MPRSRKRLLTGALLLCAVPVLVMVLRIGLEWRQALLNLNAMIVTPVALPTFTLPTVQPTSQTAAAHAGNARDITTRPTTGPTALPNLSKSQVNILLLGTDARPAEQDPTRTDAMVLVNINRDQQRINVLSFPRDLWVTYPNNGDGRINAAFPLGERQFGVGGGAALAKATVANLVGLPIDYFVLVNFQGFRGLIDYLNGITVAVPKTIHDDTFPTDDYGIKTIHFDAGLQQMDGEQALIYARTRHADSDFGRIQRQQLVLMAIFNRIRDRGLLQQITSFDDYTGALRDYVRTDMSASVMLELASWGRNLKSDDIQRFAIDSRAIVMLNSPATFAADPRALHRIVAQFTDEPISSVGNE